MTFAVLTALAVVTLIAIALLRSRPAPAAGPRITIRRGAFAALAADPQPLPAERVEDVLERLAPARGAQPLTTRSSAWAGLNPSVVKGAGRLVKAHVDAFWNLSATIDVERLRVVSDGLSTTISSCDVQVCATPINGGSSQELSFHLGREDQDVVPEQIVPEVQLGEFHAGAQLDGGSALDVHDWWSAALHAIPVGTALTSGFREGKLLLRGDTEAGRAAKNLGVDVASVATLSQIGAAIGIVAGPAGVAAGGVLGALFGKFAGSHIKSRPLRRAVKAHEAAWTRYDAEMQLVRADSEHEWNAVVAEETARYRQTLEAANARQLHVAERLELDLRVRASLTAADAARRLDVGEERVAKLLRSAPSGRAKRLLHADARAWRAEAKRLRAGWHADPEHTEALFDLLLALPGEASAAQAHAENARSRRGAALTTLADTVSNLTDEFARLWRAAVDLIDARLEDLRGRMAKRLEEHVATIEATLQVLRAEARRAGHAGV